MTKRLDVKTVRQQAQGRWLSILPAVDSRLIPAISANGAHVPCPVGTGKTDGFRIPLKSAFDGHAFSNQLPTNALSNGFDLLMWLNDWDFRQALIAVDSVLNTGAHNMPIVPTKPVSAPPMKDMSARRKVFDRWLHESNIEPDLPHIKYLLSRDLIISPAIRSNALRYHKAIPFYHDGQLVRDSQTGQPVTTPAILAGMRSNNNVVGFSVIRITSEGEKASEFMSESIYKNIGVKGVQAQSKQLFSITPKMSGGCFRLGTPARVWSVGEGLETMLAVSEVLKTESIGATMTAALLANVQIPDGVEVLNIYADKDKSGRGEEAAETLKQREKDNMKVNIFVPSGAPDNRLDSLDWLDCKRELARSHLASLDN